MKTLISYFKEIFGYIKEKNFKQLKMRLRRTMFGMKFGDGFLFKLIIYIKFIIAPKQL